MAITPPGAGTFTVIHFVVLALLILATLAVIAAGVRRSRARKLAERQVEAEAKVAGVADGGAPSTLCDAPPATRPPARPDADLAAAPPEDEDLARLRATEPDPIATSQSSVDAPLAHPPVDAPTAPAARAPSIVRLHDAAPMSDAVPPGAVDAAPANGPADGSVTQLKGLGPKVATRLAELGIVSVGQIAALDADDAQALDARLGPFAGRLHRDRWVEQARFLAAGDKAGFEAVFGRL